MKICDVLYGADVGAGEILISLHDGVVGLESQITDRAGFQAGFKYGITAGLEDGIKGDPIDCFLLIVVLHIF